MQLDQIHDHDPRILELAMLFERAIQVINDEITNQNTQAEVVVQPPQPTGEQDGDFLIAKKIEKPVDRYPK